MVDNPVVSVIMIFLNAREFLHEAIGSVLKQSYTSWELLLVDDGSNDGSTTIAQKYAVQYAGRIHYFQHPDHENLGMSAARNLGIRHAKGEFIAFLDADDICLPDKLAHQVKILSSHPTVGMTYGSTLYWHSWTGLPKDLQRDYVPPNGVELNALLYPPRLLQLYLSGQSAVPCTCSLMIRSETIRRVAGFEESFRGMYEDQAFYAKVCLSESVIVSDKCLDRYRQHPNSHSFTAEHSGQSHLFRLAFLRWLADYMSQQEIESPLVWMTLREEIWLINEPSKKFLPSAFYSVLRRIKKWILRLERQILPDSVRLWTLRKHSIRTRHQFNSSHPN